MFEIIHLAVETLFAAFIVLTVFAIARCACDDEED